MKKDKLLSLITAFMIFATGNSYTVKAETKNTEVYIEEQAKKGLAEEVYGWKNNGQKYVIKYMGVHQMKIDGVEYYSLSKGGVFSQTITDIIKDRTMGNYDQLTRKFTPNRDYFKNGEEVEIIGGSKDLRGMLIFSGQYEKYEDIIDKEIDIDELAEVLISTGYNWYSGKEIELKPVDETIPNVRKGQFVKQSLLYFKFVGNRKIDGVYDIDTAKDLKIVMYGWYRDKNSVGFEVEAITNEKISSSENGYKWEPEFLEKIGFNNVDRYTAQIKDDFFESLGMGHIIRAFRNAETNIDGEIYYDVEKLRIAYSQIPEEYRITYDWYYKEHPEALNENNDEDVKVDEELSITKDKRSRVKLLEEKF